MKRRSPPNPRDRIANRQRARRDDTNESPELDDAELEEIESELARRMLELES